MSSCQLLLGLPGFLLPGSSSLKVVLESKFQTFFAHIHTIWVVCSLFHHLHNFPGSLSSYSFEPGLSTALRQKSISASTNIRFVFPLFGHISQLYVIIFSLSLLFMFSFQSIPFSTAMSFFPSRFRSFIAVSSVLWFVISTPKYLYFAQHLISFPFSCHYIFCGVWSHHFTNRVVLYRSHHFWNVFVIIVGSPDLERSNLIGIIRKTRNVFKNLRFCEKGKIALDN